MYRLLRYPLVTLITLSLASGLLEVPCAAQTELGTVVTLLPEAAQAPAPTWLKPGLRLTYYSAAATVAGLGKTWRPDPNGGWQTPDGRRWSGSEKMGASGHGYTQFDITALDRHAVAVSISSYLTIDTGGSPLLMGQMAAVGAPGACTDLWINPEALKHLTDRDTGALKVVRMPYKIGGSARPAVWIESSNSRGYAIYIYEESTGLLLHSATSSAGARSPIIGSDEPSNTPNTTLTLGTLVAVRRIDYPWAADSAPDWVANVQSLQYTGTITNYLAGSPPLSLQYGLNLNTIARGGDWVRCAVSAAAHSSLGGPSMPTQWEVVSGPGQFGGLWLPPQGLARLHAGQELDRDAVTGVVTTVERSGRAPGGGEMVMIKTASRSQQIEYGYERSTGRLVYLNRMDTMSTGFATTRMQTRLSLQHAR